MKELVGVVNFMKVSSVKSRLFEKLCADLRFQLQHILFYSNLANAKRLSGGKRLRRLQQKCRSFSMKKIVNMPFGFKIRNGSSKHATPNDDRHLLKRGINQNITLLLQNNYF